jgi:hypothetical protein
MRLKLCDNSAAGDRNAQLEVDEGVPPPGLSASRFFGVTGPLPAGIVSSVQLFRPKASSNSHLSLVNRLPALAASRA